MTSYRYLGYGTTDSNGVAHLTKNASGQDVNGYVGTGAGEVDVIASLDNPISQGSIVSETLSVMDTLLYDTGTDPNHNIWTGDTSNLTRGSEYSRLEESTVGTMASINATMPTGLWVLTMTVKRDGLGGQWNINILNNNVSVFGCGTPNNDVWTDITLVYDGSFIYYFENGSTTPVKKTSVMLDESETTVLRLQTPQDITYVDFKDLIVLREGMSNISIGSTTPIIQSGSTATINGTLYESGLPVQNATLDVYKNGTKVGTASTGNTGVASYSYTGTGVGECEFQFKYGSLSSETYEVLDCLFYDDGTQTPTSSRYNITSSDTSTSVVTDGIKIERTASTGSSYCDIKINNSTSWRDNNTNYCIECDVEFGRPSGSNGSLLFLFGGQSISTWDLTHLTSSNGHLKLETDGTTLKPYWEGTHISASDKTMSSTDGFRFQLYQASWITFKNLKIYPI